MGQGLISWLGAAVVAILLVRFIRPGRRPLWVEITVGLIGALIGGMIATALDFGGWVEPDPRAFTFAFLVTAAALGVTRGAALLTRR